LLKVISGIEMKLNTVVEHVKKILIEWPILATYLALWFLSITFYDRATLHLHERPDLIAYGLALLEAVLLSKFLVTAQMVVPYGFVFNPNFKITFYLAIIVRTTLASLVVLMLRYLDAGVRGLVKHQGFIESMKDFCQGDVDQILSFLFLYWMVVLPYITYRFILHIAVDADLVSLLISKRSQNKSGL